MIRVLQVVNRMGFGGIETFIMNIYRNIDRSKFQFDFAVHSKEKGEYDDEIRNMGGKIYYFSSRRDNIYNYYKNWNDFLKNNASKYNAIHMHVSSVTTLLPIKLAKKYNIKNRIVHAHSTSQPGKLHDFLIKINIKNLEKYTTDLIACSTEAGRYVFENKKYSILTNGVDLKKYSYNINERNIMRNKLKIKDDIVFVHIGRFVKLKNHMFLLKIFKEINKLQPNSKLLLIGDGELRENFLQNLKGLEIEDKVLLMGNINNVCQILQGCDIFIMPSIYEGLPIACIEAQASGLKCFLSDTISKETDITGLVKFISLDLNEKEWSRLIINNCNYERKKTDDKIIKAHYNIQDTINQLLKKYY